MKKFLLYLFILNVLSLSARAQIKISDFPAYTGYCDTCFVPVLKNGTNYKMRGKFLHPSVDSIYQSGSTINYRIGGVWKTFSISAGSNGLWGSITGNINSQTDLITLLNAKEPVIPSGSALQYLRGNKLLGRFDSSVYLYGDPRYLRIDDIALHPLDSTFWATRGRLYKVIDSIGGGNHVIFSDGLVWNSVDNHVRALFQSPIWNANRIQGYPVSPVVCNGCVPYLDSANRIIRWRLPDSAAITPIYDSLQQIDLSMFALRQALIDTANRHWNRMNNIGWIAKGPYLIGKPAQHVGDNDSAEVSEPALRTLIESYVTDGTVPTTPDITLDSVVFTGDAWKTAHFYYASGRIDTAGFFDRSVPSFSVTNNADNRIITATGSPNVVLAQDNLTFDDSTLTQGGSHKPLYQMIGNTYVNGIPTGGPVAQNVTGRLYGNSHAGMGVQGYSSQNFYPGMRLQGYTYSSTSNGVAPIIIEGFKAGTLGGYSRSVLSATDTVFSVYNGPFDSAGVLLMSITGNGNMYVAGTVNGGSGGGGTVDASIINGSANAVSGNAVYNNALIKRTSLIFPTRTTFAAPQPSFGSTVGTAPIEILNMGSAGTSTTDSIHYNTTGLVRVNGRLNLVRNVRYDSVNTKWITPIHDATGYGSALLELGGEAVILHASPSGADFSDVPHEILMASANGTDGPSTADKMTSGYYVQTKAPLFARYSSAAYNPATTANTWNPSTSADPLVWLSTGEAKGTDNELQRLEGNLATPAFYFRRTNGTMGSPTITSATASAGTLGWKFYDGSADQITASIDAISNSSVSAGNIGGSIRLRTSNTNTAGLTTRMQIKNTGAVQLNAYGAGTNTGTAAYTLGVDASGNVIETTGGTGGSGTVSSGTAGYAAYYTGTTTVSGTSNFQFDNANNALKVSSAAGANPGLMLADGDQVLPNLSAFSPSPALGATEIGRFGAATSTTGGLQVSGFGSTNAASFGTLLNGYLGSNVPTNAAVVIRGGKWDGVSNFTTLGSTETPIEFRNWTITLGRFKGSGQFQLPTYGTGAQTGTLAYAIGVDASGNLIETAAGSSVLAINTHTASYTLVLGDGGSMVRQNVATANNVTVPLNASVAFPVGTQITIENTGAGQVTIVPTGGVTINSAGGALKLRVQFSAATLIKTATDTWSLSGDIVL